jgi:tyrosine-protein kinase Etk/Wzc
MAASHDDHDPRPARGTPTHRGEIVTLAQLVRTLVAARWTIAGALAVALAAAGAYVFVAHPVYQSDVLVQVDLRPERLPGVEQMASLFGAPHGYATEDRTVDTEIEVLHSRQVLGAVVDELQLDVVAHPRTLPVIGDAIARRYRGEGVAPARLGLARFAWGGERFQVARLEVPKALIGKPLLVTALGGPRFRVEAPEGGTLLEGEVGKPATAGEGDERVELLVTELEARPGTELVVARRSFPETVDQLGKELLAAERGKKTAVIGLTLEGKDPARVAAILDAVVARYLKLRAERNARESARTLSLVEAQLPQMKTNLEKAEAALHAFRQRNDTVNLPEETHAAITRAVDVEKQLTDLEIERADLQKRYSDRYPGISALDEKIAALRAKRAAMDVRMRTLPEKDLQSARLTRDVNTAAELYVLLLNKAQELRVVSARPPQDVRVLDRAVVPTKPVAPRQAPAFALALLVGLGAGVVLVLARASLAEGADDPADVEAGTGLPVLATVPHSDMQNKVERVGRSGHGTALSALDPADVAVENLRSLRTSLESALSSARNNIVSIDGPTPGVGKSFVCVNLGYLLAAAGRRVLVIDADLRRGRLNRQFGLPRDPGLSQILAGEIAVDAAIRHADTPGLDLIPSGRLPTNPAELLASLGFKTLLDDVSRRYDVVLVDTPSILAVTDCAIVARHAGLNLLVLRAGEHPVAEITLAVDRLSQNGIKIQGAILNDVRAANGRYGRHGRYRRYDYRRAAEE